MALPNTPKTDWDTDDGVQFTDLNEIGENLEHLEDVKTDEGGSPTFDKIILDKYYKNDNITEIVLYAAIGSWIPNTGDFLAVHGQYIDSGTIMTIVGMYTTSSIKFKLVGVDQAGTSTAVEVANDQSSIIDHIEIMSNFDAII